MLKKRIIFFFLFVALNGVTQEKNELIQQRIEFISEQLESEEIDLTNLVEILNFYFDHPLNLNSATREQLEDLTLLSDIQINDLLLHRQAFGKFISIYELQSLPFWDMQTIQFVLPFVKVDDKLDQLHVNFKEAVQQGKFEMFLRYQGTPEQKSGYEDVPDSVLQNSNSYYLGNSDRYYTRLRYSYRTNLSAGITAEKDPGEEFFRGTQRQGFDFYSAHAFFKGGKYLKTVALGDYQVQIGQGLNLWSGYAFGKTADATNIKKTANSLRPYTSVDETRFLRGAAVEVGYGSFSLVTFGSYKKVDGAFVTDTIASNEIFVSSLDQRGLHRTNREVDRKDGLTEIISGANLKYAKQNFQAGLAAVYQGFDQPFIKDTLAYNTFDFRGKGTTALSADYSWVVKNFNFFGEVSYATHSSSFAQLYGALFSIDSRASMSVAYRNYNRAYQTFYNAGFAESSSAQNEKGLYTGIKVALSRAWSVNAYADVFKFPWLRYQVDAPSVGHEFMIQPSFKPNRELEIYARYREQVRQKNSRNSDGTVTGIEDVRQRNYRINFNYKVSESFRLKSRLEYVTINRKSNTPEAGFVVIQDVQFQPKSFPLEFSLRYALFDTDSYDSRIYTFESNALYVFSAPAYYYQGSRAYAMIRYSFLRKCDLWVRYGVSIYANRQSIGSGSEQILGSSRSDVTVQLRIQL